MPSVCLDDCGLTVGTDGRLGVNWGVVGSDRVCTTVALYSAAPAAAADWVTVSSGSLSWVNSSCRTHRAVARMQIPYTRIRLGGGNNWQVRSYLDGAINAAAPFDGNRPPEMSWANNWYNALPAGTDTENTSPGSAEVEFLVPAGATLNIAGVNQYRSLSYNTQPINRLEIAAWSLSVMAWPSKTNTGSGRVAC